MKNAILVTYFISICLFGTSQKAIIQTSSTSPKAPIILSIDCYNTGYTPGLTQTFYCKLKFFTDDYEFLSGVRMVFPSGIIPQSAGTSNPLAENNTGEPTALSLNITGQTANWGETDSIVSYGPFYNDSAEFTISASVTPGLSGIQTIVYYLYGDMGTEYSGSITLNAALQNDIAIIKSPVQSKLISDSTNYPSAQICNFGQLPASFDAVCTILNDSGYSIYSDTITGMNLSAAKDTNVVFAAFVPLVGFYRIEYSCIYPSDQQPTNNIFSKLVFAHPDFYAFATVRPDSSSSYKFSKYHYGEHSFDCGTYQTSNGISELFWANNLLHAVKRTYYLAPSSLLEIDTISTNITSETNLGNLSIIDMFANPKSGKIYGINQSTNGTNLFRIVPETDSVFFLKKFPIYPFDIAFDSSGTLFLICNDSKLFTINIDSLTYHEVADLNMSLANTNIECEIFFDPVTNYLFAELMQLNHYNTLGIIDLTNNTFFPLEKDNILDIRIQSYARPYASIQYSNDASIIAVNKINPSCNQTQEYITTLIKNNGSAPISHFPVSYTVNHGTPLVETFTDTIPAGGFAYFTFSVPADVAGLSDAIIMVSSALAGDENPGNDKESIYAIISSTNAIPYICGFNDYYETETWTSVNHLSNASYWSFLSGLNANSPDGFTQINYSYPGYVANDWLISPCLTLTPGTYELSFWQKGYNCMNTHLIIAYDSIPSFNSTGLNHIVYDHTGFSDNSAYEKSTAVFDITSSGTYYFGVYIEDYSATGAAFYLDDFSIGPFSSIEEGEKKWSLFPNPASDFTTLVLNAEPDQSSSYALYCMDGRLAGSEKITFKEQNIDLTKLEPGLYYFSIINDDTIFSAPLLIQK